VPYKKVAAAKVAVVAVSQVSKEFEVSQRFEDLTP
jgi:hypothetical protein